MNGYDASVLNRADARILVVGLNWLGDGVMSMPAIQVLRESLHADAKLDLLVKPGQKGLWDMHESIGRIHTLAPGNSGPFQTGRLLREEAYTHSVILPNSFRSALAPWSARIPKRRGTARQLRRGLINDRVDLAALDLRHQQWEMARLLLPGPLPGSLPDPQIRVAEETAAKASSILDAGAGPRLGLVPGAARGASKCWPGERYRQVAEQFVESTGGSVFWLGVPEDRGLCEELMQGLPRCHNLAGQTGLQVFTAVLGQLDVIVANDSGGMHLAAAVGTPVVAIYGITDPDKTGPLGEKSVVLQHATVRSREVPRESEEARRALELVRVSEVHERVLAFLPSEG